MNMKTFSQGKQTNYPCATLNGLPQSISVLLRHDSRRNFITVQPLHFKAISLQPTCVQKSGNCSFSDMDFPGVYFINHLLRCKMGQFSYNNFTILLESVPYLFSLSQHRFRIGCTRLSSLRWLTTVFPRLN